MKTGAMKYVDEFRNRDLAAGLAQAIAAAARPDRVYRFMEFCGGHTHAVARYGLPDLLPDNVKLIHGPGCPVCVLPIGRIDDAIAVARNPDVILCTYGDVMRAPASERMTLMKAKAAGADVRVVLSSMDAVALAAGRPDRRVVFFAVGFETTTPPTAAALKRAEALGLKNFSVFCNHVLTPPAMRRILDAADGKSVDGNAADGAEAAPALDGVIGPAHVSTVTGWRAYADLAETYRKPVTVAGFEPLDVLQAVLMLVRQVEDGRAEVENQYVRAVTADGNRKAQQATAETMEPRASYEWRGLGETPFSALKIRDAYAGFDAERLFDMPGRRVADHKACECGAILRGAKSPADCKLFAVACTPDNPLGACMVSSEGACAAHFAYGRFRRRPAGAL